VLNQSANNLAKYFKQDAIVRWHNTNELFTFEEFIAINCEYPGQWQGVVVRMEIIGDLVITVTKVFSLELNESYHVTSFIKFDGQKIAVIDEYWGDDDAPPLWRLEKGMGKPIS